MKLSTFDEHRFHASVDKALQQVKSILDTTRNPRLAEHEEHKYDDKYALAEFVTNSSVTSAVEVLERLGLDDEKLVTVLSWVHEEDKPVMLRFQANDSCTFVKEEDKEKVVYPEIQVETETWQDAGGEESKKEKKMSRVIQSVKEYHWNVEVWYKLTIFTGSDENGDRSLVLQEQFSSTTIVTAGGPGNSVDCSALPISPIPEQTVHPAIDLNATWLIATVSPQEQVSKFSIDRNNTETCKTPRRNPNVDKAVMFFQEMNLWGYQLSRFFDERVETEILGKHAPVSHCTDDDQKVEAIAPSVFNISVDAVFSPVLPLMENGSVLSQQGTGGELLKAHKQTLDEALKSLSSSYPSPSAKRSYNELMDDASGDDNKSLKKSAKLVSTAEASIVLLTKHLTSLCERYMQCIDYTEGMLTKQLVQAIGKEVDLHDFNQFMRFNHHKLFGSQYAPKPFTYAIRQPNHYPDGILSIEAPTGTGKVEPVDTLVRHIPADSSLSMFIPINAATSVEITGDKYLHGWMQHRFMGNSHNHYNLAARARQFSSFMVIIGTVAGPDKFDPKDAIILQNKDEILIPLLTEVLPSAKEFKDAIASLSPEQQEFAKAFRSMQLESSVFGVCIIQLKPQLEKLLGLPTGALTKEIKLTQDLMSLFVDYQIPSDLLSYDGPVDADIATKLEAVRGHVKTVLDVIEVSKEKQLDEEKRKAEMLFEQDMMLEWSQMDTPVPQPTAQLQMMCCQPSSSAMPNSFGGASRRASRPKRSHRKSIRSQMSAGAPQPPAHFPAASGSTRTTGDVFYSSVVAQSTTTTNGREEDWTDLSSSRRGDSDVASLDDDQPSLPDQAHNPEKEPGQTEDFTLIPKVLDAQFEKFDTDKALRSTIIKAGTTWTSKRQENLLSPAKVSSLRAPAIESEKKKAFDLLDAISRSGTLAIDCSELHVVVAVSHCFENDVMGTVIQENINPITKVEKSALIVASAVYRKPTNALVHDERQLEQLTAAFPRLFSN